GDGARDPQRQIAQAAYAQERGEILHLTADFNYLIVKLGDQLIDGHAVTPADFAEHVPEEIFQPDTCHHAVQAQRSAAAVVEGRVGVNEDFAHRHLRAIRAIADWFKFTPITHARHIISVRDPTIS